MCLLASMLYTIIICENCRALQTQIGWGETAHDRARIYGLCRLDLEGRAVKDVSENGLVMGNGCVRCLLVLVKESLDVFCLC